jgi:hypothetical protein
MFIGKLSGVLFNPEGIVCKKRAILHIIPSGLKEILLYFPINIYSLREFKRPYILPYKTHNYGIF